jgi:hypothetical protein
LSKILQIQRHIIISIIYKEHKHYNLFYLEIIYKSNQSKEAWVCLDGESNAEKRKHFNLKRVDREPN